MKTAAGMIYEWSGVFPPPSQPSGDGLLLAVNEAPSKTWPAWAMPEIEGELIASHRSGRIVSIYQDLTGVAFANTYPFVTYAPDSATKKKTPITDVISNVLNSAPIPGVK